jgi:hypothetical protein
MRTYQEEELTMGLLANRDGYKAFIEKRGRDEGDLDYLYKNEYSGTLEERAALMFHKWSYKTYKRYFVAAYIKRAQLKELYNS